MTQRLTLTGRRSGGFKLIVLIIIALGLGGAGGYLAFGRKAPTVSAAGSRAHTDATDAEDETDDEGEDEDNGGDQLQYIALGAFLVNLLSEGSPRYLRAELTVGVEEKHTEGKGKKKSGGHATGPGAPTLSPADDARARDAVVRILSSQTYEHLRATGPSEELKTALTDALKHSVRDAKVRAVMLTSFVMQ